jgi:protein-disulfide isomerase
MTTLKPPLDDRDHLRGDLSRPVHLLEFGDYQCPYCGRAEPVRIALEQTFGDQLCFAFRNFPIVGAHPYAEIAAEAAEAADAQGKFWEMHDLLFENQHALEVPDLHRYAEQLGLDMGQFVADLRAHRFHEKIRADLHSGAISGVGGTPTFFINGLRHDGPPDFDTLHAAIVRALQLGRIGQ